jgi:hypothetical protein
MSKPKGTTVYVVLGSPQEHQQRDETATAPTQVSFLLRRSLRMLVVVNQFRESIGLLAGVLRVLVAKELGDATRL